MKLIKINTDHYVVVDDSKIRVGDWITDMYKIWQWQDDCSLLGRKKITHSTQPLDTVAIENSERSYKIISLQEVKESFCWLDGTEWEVEIVDGKLKLK